MQLVPNKARTTLLTVAAWSVPALSVAAIASIRPAIPHLGERCAAATFFVVLMAHIQLLRLQKAPAADRTTIGPERARVQSDTPRFTQLLLGGSWPSKITLILACALYGAAVSCGFQLVLGIPDTSHTAAVGQLGYALLSAALPAGIVAGTIAAPYVRFLLLAAGFQGPTAAELPPRTLKP